MSTTQQIASRPFPPSLYLVLTHTISRTNRRLVRDVFSFLLSFPEKAMRYLHPATPIFRVVNVVAGFFVLVLGVYSIFLSLLLLQTPFCFIGFPRRALRCPEFPLAPWADRKGPLIPACDSIVFSFFFLLFL